MTLAALVAAGASPENIQTQLLKLGISFDLDFERVEVNGVGALHARVGFPQEHVHRTFRDIEGMISASDLPENAARLAISAFHRLAVAEGEVHGKPPEEVAFHEVGAVDSIVDLVGGCVALDELGVRSVSCNPLPMGGGVVRAAHGPLPVPGPATLEVLKGSNVAWPDVPHEMTTPTGAALMWAFTGGHFTDSAPPMTLRSVGYGAGTARFEGVPNVLRAVVGRLEGASGEVEVIESNVDDASGEILGSALDTLLKSGALDAWLEPVYMKRGRGAYKVCALVKQADAHRISNLVMRSTGALGVRRYAVSRTVAERRIETVELPYGACRVKIGSLDGGDFVISPEHSDALKLSEESGLSLPRVYAEAREAVALPEAP